ncbi:MAG TPA: NAD(P)/FAD-dependent oxidoreductase [Burkholderiaceae bacterium]|nr:NAD(P)/FAD-dependent oxidoreductase [Burkholderiaceae bacterium]
MSTTTTTASDGDVASCDVLVVGGGPAGSTAAALLARQGRQVVLLEKTHHPRFHIGESLLPANVRLFDELGLRGELERIGMRKYGIEFVSTEHAHSSFLEFGDAWDKTMPYAWQVRRSVLDEILFRHAAASGAQAIEGCKVTQIDFDADGVSARAVMEDGTPRRWRARYLLDASGRDTMLAAKFGWKRKNDAHGSAAIFGHFLGARRLQGRLEGNITIFWFAHGWFWFIPLADGSTSVGAVCWPHYLKTRDKPLREFFADTIALAPGLQERLRDATLIDDQVYATGNYSYASAKACGERHALLGDAFAFIDPVFSSGLYFAMRSAFGAVELVATELDHPGLAPAARRRYEQLAQKGPKEFSWFIYRMTNPAMRELFMHPKNPLRVKEALLSLLAGDIHGRTPIWVSLALFKAIYYMTCIGNAPRAWLAWRARRNNIQQVGATKGENVLVES